MNTVQRAIIMAAGKGTRMRELTDDCPKPLLKVNGERMIDSTIDALLSNGIQEIIIVVGYHKEKFKDVTDKYPQVRLLDNPYYDTCNNISSIYMARDLLQNAMIIEGDQFFFRPAPLTAQFEHSGYNVFWTDKPTNEWVYRTDPDGKILSCLDHGAEKGWFVYGVSRWTAEDGEKLKHWITYEFEVKQNRQIYWDRVPVFLHPEEFDLYIHITDGRDRVELDSVEELAVIDESYRAFTKEDS